MFPSENYTPHGYLDNPAHAWKVPGPGGVVRSRPAIGMGWHFPSFAAAYNNKWQYRCNLQVGLKLADGTLLLDSADFKKAGITLRTSHHSKNILCFTFMGSIYFMAEFCLPDETGNTLLCNVLLGDRTGQAQKISVIAVLDYERNLGQGLTWESGMFTRSYEKPDYKVENSILYAGHTLGVFQEGTHFHLLAGAMGQNRAETYTVKSYTNLPDLNAVRDVIEKGKTSSAATGNHRVSFSEIELDLRPQEGARSPGGGLLISVGRGESEIQAINAAKPYFQGYGNIANEAFSKLKQQDRKFWDNAPKLSGDWPAHIRNGLVYDMETLRAIVRRPAGIYKHRWDAMQGQVPRIVLAEAALDMLILSYADPETAKEVLYGTFADAPEPNIPCSREDGSYNMIASDGSPCGTAPEWCFPFHCINLVYKRTGDKEWLGKLYPLMEDYIGFWITQRLDGQGRPYYKCSWESGQDNSPRFGIKDDPSGGGALTEHIWPSDLQAALAQSCNLLAEWGVELGRDSGQWGTLGERFARATQLMWHNDWFHDFDTSRNHFTDVLDTMQLAPLLCGAATSEHVAALIPKLENPPKHGQIFHPLMWPSTAFCLVEACHESGRADIAAWHSWATIDPVYRWLDSDPESVETDKGGLPGVSREYWPQVVAPQANPPRGGGGAEVYGWGCFTAMMLLRYIVGFVEEHDGFTLTPNLPPELLQTGKMYKVGQLRWHNARIEVTYTVGDKLAAKVEVFLYSPAAVQVQDGTGRVLYDSPSANGHSFQINVTNGSGIRFVVSGE